MLDIGATGRPKLSRYKLENFTNVTLVAGFYFEKSVIILSVCDIVT